MLTAEVPEKLRDDPESLAGCISGAATIGELETMLGSAGFEAIRIEPEEGSEAVIREWSEEYDLSDVLVSARIEGRKPTVKATREERGA